MKHIFKLTFCTFFITGIFVFGTLFAGIINEFVVDKIGSFIVVPEKIFEMYFSIFKICGIITLASFPPIILNVIVRGFQEESSVQERKKFIPIVAAFFLILVVIPITLFLVEGKYENAGMYTLVWIAAAIIGGAGEKYPIPFEKIQ